MPKENTTCCDNSSSCCCGQVYPPDEGRVSDQSSAHWVTGRILTSVGEVLQVSTSLNSKDILGSWKARWGINRDNYRINPGLYGIGNPTDKSPVLVTANYKMSFDRLRQELSGLDVWILVLETNGVNVWCAAGKGLFGTAELVRRIEVSGLPEVVSHRTLILPQLGATGVAAHEVLKQSGFRVIYGPVRASDTKEFIERGMKASKEMRTVEFSFTDRIILTPVELVHVIKPLAVAIIGLAVLNLFGIKLIDSFGGLIPYLGAIITGCVIVPALLPWIPGRAFALKGWLVGLLWTVIVVAYNAQDTISSINWSEAVSYLLILPAISSFLAVNFTGSSTYTSLSGVLKEMKNWLPIIIGSACLGIIFTVVKTFMNL